MSVMTKLFTPSGKKFFDLFEQVADNLKQMCALFVELVNTADRQERRRLLDKIEWMENKNDDTTHKLFVELGRNFVTPFDREDIHFLSSSLDDIADMMWGASKQLYHYDIDKPEVAQETAARLTQFIYLLEESIRGLRKRTELNALVALLQEMRVLTGNTDKQVITAVSSMFDNSTTTVELIKLSDHYNVLQVLNNKCGEVINVMESVVVKYG